MIIKNKFYLINILIIIILEKFYKRDFTKI
jgi:hypothetical protein